MKTVMTHGTFDLLHYGHIAHLERCKTYGDYLIAGVTCDAAVAARKGDDRPIIPLEQRMVMVGSLKMVDKVVEIPYITSVFVDNLLSTIFSAQPDIFVTTYGAFSERISEFAAHNIKLVIVPEIRLTSTSDIIAKIRSSTPKAIK